MCLCSALKFQGEKSACLAWAASRAGHRDHMATHKRGYRCRYPVRGPGRWAGKSHRHPPRALLWDGRPGPAHHGASVLSTHIRLGHPGRRYRTAPWVDPQVLLQEVGPPPGRAEASTSGGSSALPGPSSRSRQVSRGVVRCHLSLLFPQGFHGQEVNISRKSR